MHYEDTSEDELSTDVGSDVDDGQNGLVDVEDLGTVMNSQKTADVSSCLTFHNHSDYAMLFLYYKSNKTVCACLLVYLFLHISVSFTYMGLKFFRHTQGPRGWFVH